MMNNKGQAAFTGIIGAIAGAAIGGVIAYYIAFVVINSLNLATDPIWALVLLLIPLSIAAIIAAVIVRIFS